MTPWRILAGLTFLAAVIPAGLALLCVKPRAAGAALAWSMPVLAALVYGFWQLAQAPGPSAQRPAVGVPEKILAAGAVLASPPGRVAVAGPVRP